MVEITRGEMTVVFGGKVFIGHRRIILVLRGPLMVVPVQFHIWSIIIHVVMGYLLFIFIMVVVQ